jgi:hypothetical protein
MTTAEVYYYELFRYLREACRYNYRRSNYFLFIYLFIYIYVGLYIPIAYILYYYGVYICMDANILPSYMLHLFIYLYTSVVDVCTRTYMATGRLINKCIYGSIIELEQI